MSRHPAAHCLMFVPRPHDSQCQRDRVEHFRLLRFWPLGQQALSLRKCAQPDRRVGSGVWHGNGLLCRRSHFPNHFPCLANASFRDFSGGRRAQAPLRRAKQSLIRQFVNLPICQFPYSHIPTFIPNYLTKVSVLGIPAKDDAFLQDV